MKQNASDKTIYEIQIDRAIATLLTGEDIAKDILIAIDYSGVTLFSMTATVFNQRLYEKKLAELKDESTKKKNKRDPAKIKALVDTMQAYSKEVGNPVPDAKVIAATDKLQNERDEVKVQSTVSEVGEWILKAGKLILPLLL